jgi:hypothetical protein
MTLEDFSEIDQLKVKNTAGLRWSSQSGLELIGAFLRCGKREEERFDSQSGANCEGLMITLSQPFSRL